MNPSFAYDSTRFHTLSTEPQVVSTTTQPSCFSSLTSVMVSFSPGAKATPHRHGDAFVYVYVLSGTVRSQINDEPAKVYHAGQDWYEPPGSHHVVAENVSATDSAKLLVIFVANTGDALKIPDQH